MRTKNLIFALLLYPFLCVAQDQNHVELDSLAIQSRMKADNVLQLFDTIQSAKLLYSLDDKFYYIIVQTVPCYTEYYITLSDMGTIDKISYISNKSQSWKQRKQYKRMLTKAEPIFNFNRNKNSKFVTEMYNAKYSNGRMSYFVLKDAQGNRYTEYRLPTISSQLPIHMSLLAYLIMRISNEMGKTI